MLKANSSFAILQIVSLSLNNCKPLIAAFGFWTEFSCKENQFYPILEGPYSDYH